MSATAQSILAQLKVKKERAPQAIVPLKYAKAQQPVKLNVAVEDKRPTARINRTEILSKLGKKPTVQSEIAASEMQAEEQKFTELEIKKATEEAEIKDESDDEESEDEGKGMHSCTISFATGLTAAIKERAMYRVLPSLPSNGWNPPSTDDSACGSSRRLFSITLFPTPNLE